MTHHRARKCSFIIIAISIAAGSLLVSPAKWMPKSPTAGLSPMNTRGI